MTPRHRQRRAKGVIAAVALVTPSIVSASHMPAAATNHAGDTPAPQETRSAPTMSSPRDPYTSPNLGWFRAVTDLLSTKHKDEASPFEPPGKPPGRPPDPPGHNDPPNPPGKPPDRPPSNSNGGGNGSDK